jgi:hypothetical protein
VLVFLRQAVACNLCQPECHVYGRSSGKGTPYRISDARALTSCMVLAMNDEDHPSVSKGVHVRSGL